MKKILIIRLSAMGDVLLTTPVVTRIKSQFGDAEIHFLVKEQYAEFIAACPDVDQVHVWRGVFAAHSELDLGFDLILDLQSNLKSRLLSLLLKADEKRRYKKPYLKRLMLVRFGKNHFKNRLKITERYLDALSGILPDAPLTETIALKRTPLPMRLLNQIGSEYVLIAPGARWGTKRWPTEYFVSLASKILEKNATIKIVWLGGVAEAEIFSTLSAHPYLKRHAKRMVFLAGELRTTEIATIADGARVAVTNDSGLMHALSSAVTPLFALFLSTVEEFGFYPLGQRSTVLSARNISCRPCSHTGLATCPKKHFKCGYELTADQVYASLTPFLSPRKVLSG